MLVLESSKICGTQIKIIFFLFLTKKIIHIRGLKDKDQTFFVTVNVDMLDSK